MFARSINFVGSWAEMRESSINNLSKDHCTTSAIFVLRVSAKPTVCGHCGGCPAYTNGCFAGLKTGSEAAGG